MMSSAAHDGSWLEIPQLGAELLVRNLYWRCAALRRWRRRQLQRRRPVIQECRREDLRAHLSTIGVCNGALVLLHTRITGVRIHAEVPAGAGGLLTLPELLLSDMINLLGPMGTLVMPTNAKYQREILEDRHSRNEILTYDPSSTHCSVGLTNEYFWREMGAKRSLFPFNMLAAHGPLADELLDDNLNDRKPSPHGVDSGYYRICRHNGLMLSIGLPLADCMTLAHVVEEVRADWPIKDFFVERRYRVVQNGMTREWIVRQVREEYDKLCHCRRKMARDMVAEGVIHEGSVGTLRLDWARAGEVYDFFWRKTEKRPYPYYGLWLGRV